jgi:hypothetical protein
MHLENPEERRQDTDIWHYWIIVTSGFETLLDIFLNFLYIQLGVSPSGLRWYTFSLPGAEYPSWQKGPQIREKLCCYNKPRWWEPDTGCGASSLISIGCENSFLDYENQNELNKSLLKLEVRSMSVKLEA